MPDPNASPFPNPPASDLGQGVREIPQPPDPFEKLAAPSPLEQIPSPVSPAPSVPPVTQLPEVPPPAAAMPKPDVPHELKQPTPGPVEPPTIPTPTPPPPPPPPPTAFIPKPVMPEAPTEEQYKRYSQGFNLPQRRRLSPWLFIAPVVLVLLGAAGFGIFYFLKLQATPSPSNEDPLLLLSKEEEIASDSTPAAGGNKTEPAVLSENGFGNLPPPDLENFSLAGLSLAGVIVANESTASALPEKANVFRVSEQNMASSSSYYSPEHPIILGQLKQPTPHQFNSRVSGQSLYAVKNSGLALTQLVSSAKLFGVAEKKTDWTKNKLKSLQIFNNYLIHFYPAQSKYWYPVYVFEGEGKLAGDAKSAALKIIFLLPAINP